MSRHIFKLPDLGEGTVSAEIIAWHVKPGDLLKEDQPLVEMSTDKAVVEIPSPVSGRVLSITGKPGRCGRRRRGAGKLLTRPIPAAASARHRQPPAPKAAAAPPGTANTATPAPGGPRRAAGAPVRASPATRRRAQEAGINLASRRGLRHRWSNHSR